MKVRKLPQYADISAVRLDEKYLGKITKNKLVSLNNNVKGKLVNKDRLEKEEGMIAVKVVRINLPHGIELEYIPGNYEIEEEAHDISSFTLNDIGREFVIHARVEKVRQSAGPTLFTLFDGTGTISAKAFAGPGKRAFPDIKEGLAISAKIQLREYDNNLEAELVSFRIVDNKKINDKINSIADKKAEPDNTDFMISSEILEKLRPRITEFARIVKKAMLESRPVIIRHHADADGYCAGIALERAILPKLMDLHGDPKAIWKFYKRSPLKAPFYGYSDAVKDLSHSMEESSRFGTKEPLVIIADNGSTEEDILGIRKIKVYGAKVVVLDHHYPGDKDEKGKCPVDYYADSHLNPYLEGGDMSMTAGMLAPEVARFINKDAGDIEILPALAGLGDKSECSEIKKYIKIAEDKGLTLEYMKKLVKVIDFEAHHLRFIESRELVNDLLGASMKKQKELVELIIPEISFLEKEQLKAARNYSRIEDTGKSVIARVDIEKVNRQGKYPSAGKATGMLHDSVSRESDKPVITLSLGRDFMTIRANKAEGFNVHDVISRLREKIPHGFIDGGGHEFAGTVKFIEAARNEVMEIVNEYLEKWR